MDYFTLLATIAGMLAGVGADTVGQDMGNTSSIVGDMTLRHSPVAHRSGMVVGATTRKHSMW